ncbi:MAG TPA: hypothetical protein PLD59_14840 [Tepidisphaeraceae bacterium]|nr:hypothetical protein [Tepidisphaeraceae bacterium]
MRRTARFVGNARRLAAVYFVNLDISAGATVALVAVNPYLERSYNSSEQVHQIAAHRSVGGVGCR